MRPLERLNLLESIATQLQSSMSTSDINALLRSLGLHNDLQDTVSSKRVYAKEKLAALDDERLFEIAADLAVPTPVQAPRDQGTKGMPAGRTVFVIHGRDETIRAELFAFLRAAGLDPLEWSEAVKLTGKGAPYIGEVLERAFAEAAAVLVLLTPDDEVRLLPDLVRTSDPPSEREFQHQPRPNVIFEAGMAFGRHADRTILVAIGRPKEFSDVAGRHVIHLTNSVESRLDLLGRLESAGCDVRAKDRRDWLSTGEFEISRTRRPEASVPPTEEELGEIDTNILRLVAKFREVDADFVSSRLRISETAAEHYLETLEERKFLHARYAVGRDPIYVLDKSGRAYIVRHALG